MRQRGTVNHVPHVPVAALRRGGDLCGHLEARFSVAHIPAALAERAVRERGRQHDTALRRCGDAHRHAPLRDAEQRRRQLKFLPVEVASRERNLPFRRPSIPSVVHQDHVEAVLGSRHHVLAEVVDRHRDRRERGTEVADDFGTELRLREVGIEDVARERQGGIVEAVREGREMEERGGLARQAPGFRKNTDRPGVVLLGFLLRRTRKEIIVILLADGRRDAVAADPVPAELVENDRTRKDRAAGVPSAAERHADAAGGDVAERVFRFAEQIRMALDGRIGNRVEGIVLTDQPVSMGRRWKSYGWMRCASASNQSLTVSFCRSMNTMEGCMPRSRTHASSSGKSVSGVQSQYGDGGRPLLRL